MSLVLMGIAAKAQFCWNCHPEMGWSLSVCTVVPAVTVISLDTHPSSELCVHQPNVPFALLN